MLVAEDEDLGCPCFEERFWVDRLSNLVHLLGEQCADDPKLRNGYWLDRDELLALRSAFGAGAEFAAFENVLLEDWREFRDMPYLVHTRFELFLLLEGRKQFAQFEGTSEWLDDFLQPYERHVAEGRLVRRDVDVPVPPELQALQIGDGPPLTFVRRALFVRPGQEWRIDAFLTLWEVCELTGWSDALEAFEVVLYGYEDWQIRWWLEHRRARCAGALLPSVENAKDEG